MAEHVSQAGLWPEAKIEVAAMKAATSVFGERMRREREMRNISLVDIAESTKITARMLRALEEEDFDKLPGGIFNKGFVRSYARFLGIDEEQAVSDYVVALKTRQQSAAPGVTANEPDPLPAIYAAKRREGTAKEPDQAAAFMIAGVILVIALGVGGFIYKTREAKQAASAHVMKQIAAPVHAAKVSQSTVAQAVQTPVTQVAQPVTKPPIKESDTTQSSITENAISVKLHAQHPSWVQILSDGKVLMEGELEAESEKSFTATKELVVKLGNAGGVEVSFNGTPLAPFSAEMKTKTLTFTPDGLR